MIKLNIQSDTLGLICSGICFVHCLILPLFLGALSDYYLPDDLFHPLILIPAFSIAFVSFKKGYQIHKYHASYIIGGIGLSCMCLAISQDEFYETLFTLVGIFLLGSAHVLNHRLCCRFHSCSHQKIIGAPCDE